MCKSTTTTNTTITITTTTGTSTVVIATRLCRTTKHPCFDSRQVQ